MQKMVCVIFIRKNFIKFAKKKSMRLGIKKNYSALL